LPLCQITEQPVLPPRDHDHSQINDTTTTPIYVGLVPAFVDTACILVLVCGVSTHRPGRGCWDAALRALREHEGCEWTTTALAPAPHTRPVQCCGSRRRKYLPSSRKAHPRPSRQHCPNHVSCCPLVVSARLALARQLIAVRRGNGNVGTIRQRHPWTMGMLSYSGSNPCSVTLTHQVILRSGTLIPSRCSPGPPGSLKIRDPNTIRMFTWPTR
jgi:hypothetical protein